MKRLDLAFMVRCKIPVVLGTLLAVVITCTVGVAQTASQIPPKMPSEALERATEPVRRVMQAESSTYKQSVEANKEQERLAREYAVLFNVKDWKNGELLRLAKLYLYALRYADAETAYTAYLADPKAAEALLARKSLLIALTRQGKLAEAVPVASLLLDAPGYDQEIILSLHDLVDALSTQRPQQAIELGIKMLPKLFAYAESKATRPEYTGHVALILQYGLEPVRIYREIGEVAKSDAFVASFMKQFQASSLAANEMLKKAIDGTMLRARLLGAVAPVIEGTDYINMPKTSLAELNGKVVMLDFFGHWCAPCIASLPSHNELLERYGQQGLVIVGVSAYAGYFGAKEKIPPAEELAALENLLKEQNVRYGFVVGPASIGKAYGVTGLPFIAFIDRNGKVRFIKEGGLSKDELERVAKQLINEPISRERQR